MNVTISVSSQAAITDNCKGATLRHREKINRVYICFSPGSLCFGGDIFRFEAFEGEMDVLDVW